MKYSLIEKIKKNKGKEFLIGDDTLSYEELYNIMKFMYNKGNINSREAIGIFFDNSKEYVISYIFLLYNKNLIFPLYSKLGEKQIIDTLKLMKSNKLLTDFKKLKYFKRYNISFNKIYDEIYCVIFNDFLVSKYDEEDMIALNTSGSTGGEKRVIHTERSMIENIKNNLFNLDLNGNDIFQISLPLNFGYANTSQFLTAIYLGAKIILIESNDYIKQVEYLQESTTTTLVPTSMKFLKKYLDFKKINEIKNIRNLFIGGSNCDENIYEIAKKIFPNAHIYQTYGQTEAGPRITTLSYEEYMLKPKSVGKAIKNVQIKISNINSEGIGEILIKTPSVMKYILPAHHNSKISEDGWLNTGDLGFLDDDGFLFLKGRIDNMFIVGGFNIYPEEIEMALNSIDIIKESRVYPQKDDIYGNIICTDIVITSDKLEIKYIQKKLSEKLSEYKIPVIINVVNKIEKTYNKKIRRIKQTKKEEV